MSIKKTWNWYERSDDGLIKKPAPVGPYYDQDSPYSYSGYGSQEEAEKALSDFLLRHKERWLGGYLLIAEYHLERQ